MKSIRTWFAIIPFAILLAACGGAAADGTPAPGTNPSPQLIVGEFGVQMRGMAFIPQKLTIKAGSTVVWTNLDFNQYDLQSDTGLFSAPMLDSGATFRRTFEEPGTYRYYCPQHGGPDGAGMSGVIYVVP